jgi:hypothetical protein
VKSANFNFNGPLSAPPKNGERGMALFFALFALLLLTALTSALVLLTSTETSINFNYRSEEVAFFAAKAGLEEVLDRMMTTTTQTPAITPPSAVPSSSGGVVYLINPGSAAASSIQPWNYQNAYADDEFCHDYSAIGALSLQTAPPDVPCTGPTSLPTGGSWYTSVASNAPWNGTAAALPYVWVRVAMKLNKSETYLSGGTTPAISTYAVNSSLGSTAPVCWTGVSEVVLPTGFTSCSTWSNGATPVYLATSLALTSGGTRKMVQADIAATPIPTLVYGLFATASQCNAMSFSGNGYTDSYSSATGTYGGANQAETGGSVGANGSISLTGNAIVGGSVGVLNPVGGTGSCSGNFVTGDDLSTSGSAGIYTGTGDPGHQDVLTCLQASPGALCSAGPLTFAAPPAPSPLPPTTSLSYSGNSAANLVPGSYGNISLSGNSTLTLAPGVYNINSISMSANSVVSINPTGQVTLNVAGQGTANPVSLSGNANNGGANPIPTNFLINYAGTGTITVSGNGAIYTVVNAPNAPVNFSGNGAIYGAIVGSAVSYSGNAAFHFDRSVRLQSSSAAGYYIRIGYRELPY